MTNDFVATNRHWLDRYVHDIQLSMNLGHWKVVLKDGDPEDHDPDGPGNYAGATFRSNQYLAADMYLREPEGGSRDELRGTIVHELVHLHLRDYDQALNGIEDHLNRPAYDILCNWSHHEREKAVDAIAQAWARALPLPPPMGGLR